MACSIFAAETRLAISRVDAAALAILISFQAMLGSKGFLHGLKQAARYFPLLARGFYYPDIP